MRISISIKSISSPNPMFDHLLESSHQDDSNKWSNIGLIEEITQLESIEANFSHFIWYSSRTQNGQDFLRSCACILRGRMH